MRGLFLTLLLGSVCSCLQIGTPQGADGGASSTATTGIGGATAAAASGTNCGLDPSSGISLCLGISSCPTVQVDPDQFPDCGYRISGSIIDLECLCGDSLCPMGAAASCLDAKALLSDQSAQGICAEVADGKCQVVKQTATSTSSNTSANCDKDCRAECSGEPGCITLCGC